MSETEVVIERLRRSNRRWKVVAFVACAALVLTALVGFVAKVRERMQDGNRDGTETGTQLELGTETGGTETGTQLGGKASQHDRFPAGGSIHFLNPFVARCFGSLSDAWKSGRSSSRHAE
jgi:hypothetical protein